MNAFEAALQQKRDAAAKAAAAKIDMSLPAVADLARTIVERLEAGIVEPMTYLTEMRETIERKREAIGEAFIANELQPDQAAHASYIAEEQLKLVDATLAQLNPTDDERGGADLENGPSGDDGPRRARRRRSRRARGHR